MTYLYNLGLQCTGVRNRIPDGRFWRPLLAPANFTLHRYEMVVPLRIELRYHAHQARSLPLGYETIKFVRISVPRLLNPNDVA